VEALKDAHEDGDPDGQWQSADGRRGAALKATQGTRIFPVVFSPSRSVRACRASARRYRSNPPLILP